MLQYGKVERPEPEPQQKGGSWWMPFATNPDRQAWHDAVEREQPRLQALNVAPVKILL